MTVRRVMVALLAVALVAGLAGCKKEPEKPALVPVVAPPVIAAEGVLSVGVDKGYPPFAGTDEGVEAGIDIDVAAAVSERLGLTLQIVDIKPAEMSAALADGRIDVMLGAVPMTDAVLADASTAGTYLLDGSAFFAVAPEGSEVTTITPEQLPALRVGAQSASPAFWTLEGDYGEGFTRGFDTLKAAFDALAAGEIDVVAGDAAVGAYIARDYPTIAFAGQFGDAQPLGVVVRKDAVELETAIRSALDAMAADGVLATIRGKWLGNLPELTVPPAEEIGPTG